MNKYCVDKIISEMNSSQKNLDRWDETIIAVLDVDPDNEAAVDRLEAKITNERRYMEGVRFSAHLLGLDLIRSDVSGQWFVPRDLYSTMR